MYCSGISFDLDGFLDKDISATIISYIWARLIVTFAGRLASFVLLRICVMPSVSLGVQTTFESVNFAATHPIAEGYAYGPNFLPLLLPVSAIRLSS